MSDHRDWIKGLGGFFADPSVDSVGLFTPGGTELVRCTRDEWRLATAGASVPPPEKCRHGFIAGCPSCHPPSNQPPVQVSQLSAFDELSRLYGDRQQLDTLKEIALAHGWRPSEPLAGWLAQQLGKGR